MVSNYGARPVDWEAWENNASTRESVRMWTKYEPIDATLATAGTSESLLTLSHERPTVNLATNPSFETGTPPTGYTASGATLARSSTVARSGTYSLSITPDNAAASEGAYWSSGQPLIGNPDRSNTMYAIASTYLQDNADSGVTAYIVIADTSGVVLATGNTITLSSSWQRSVAVYQLPLTAAEIRAYIITAEQTATVFYADDLQIEVHTDGRVTTYCDGSQGLNNEWYGTAHASFSRRRLSMSTIKGFDLHFTRDTYVAFDNDAGISGTRVFVRAGSDWSPSHPVDVSNKITFINVNSGETPRVHGVIWGDALH